VAKLDGSSADPPSSDRLERRAPRKSRQTAAKARAGKGKQAAEKPHARKSRAPQDKRAGTDPRARMIDAMLTSVGEQGYGATVVADVIAGAVASRKTFYEHFGDKEACFLAASDEIALEWTDRVTRAGDGADDAQSAVHAVTTEMFALGSERPAALRTVAVELTAAGNGGVARRERLLDDLARPLRDAFGGESPGSQLIARAIVGSVLRILYARARRGEGVRRPRRSELTVLAPAVATWAAEYLDMPGGLDLLPGNDAAAGVPFGGRAPGTLSLSSRGIERRGLPRGEGNVSRSFVVHNQRERILDALANLSAAKGYGATTIPEIVHEAAVSVQAFYEHFSGKDDAFLVAYEIGHRKSLAIVERAYESQPNWADAVRAGIRALLEFLASEPSYAHLALIDALTANAKAAAMAHEGMRAYSGMLAPDLDTPPDGVLQKHVAVEATACALLELCFVHVAQQQARELPRLADVASELALRPFARIASD
jgi:AcrR family transcriptional regulator